MKRLDTEKILKGAAAGLIAGLAASFVMGQYQTLLSSLAEKEESPGQPEDEPATVKAAEEISEEVFDHKLSTSEKGQAGEAMHYAMGGVSGLIYGAAAEIEPLATTGAGLPFGTAVWLVADDLVVPALGLSKPPTEYTLSTHAYALSSHLVYGLTTELVRKWLRRLL